MIHANTRRRLHRFIALMLLAIGFAEGWVILSRSAPLPALRPSPLERHIAEVHLHDMPLDQALSALRKMSGADFLVDWQHLKAAGFSPRETLKLNIDLRNVTFEQVMDRFTLATRRAADDEQIARVSIRRENDAIVIDAFKYHAPWPHDDNSAEEDRLRDIETRVHDVRDLATRGGEWEALLDPPIADLSDMVKDADPLVRTRMDRIQATIKRVVEPSTWHSTGIQTGAMRNMHGYLIISQTPDNQDAIAELLRTLRGVRDGIAQP